MSGPLLVTRRAGKGRAYVPRARRWRSHRLARGWRVKLSTDARRCALHKRLSRPRSSSSRSQSATFARRVGSWRKAMGAVSELWALIGGVFGMLRDKTRCGCPLLAAIPSDPRGWPRHGACANHANDP